MNDDKVWLIEPGDVLDVMPPRKKEQHTVQVHNVPPAPARSVRMQGPRVRPLTAVAASSAGPRGKKPAGPPKAKLQFASLAILTYLLGPASILLTPRGRDRRGTIILAGVSVGLALLLLGSSLATVVRPDSPSSAWLWLAVVTLTLAGAFTAWARALHLIGAEGIPSPSKLPRWMRRGWLITAMGLAAPGSGQLLSGRPARAALTLWMAWPVVASIVILSNGMGLWRHHETSGWLAGSGLVLERILMVAASLVAVGFLGYVAQALDGVRQVLVESKLQTRLKGDYYAAGVLAFAVALVLVANPVQLARQLDLSSDILREEGFRAIPLQLTLAASHLDPARMEYSLQAMELYTELGEAEKADTIRAGLDANLATYLALVRREVDTEFGLAWAESDLRGRSSAGDARTGPFGGWPSSDPLLQAPGDADAVAPLSVGLNATYYLGTMLGANGTTADTSERGR